MRLDTYESNNDDEVVKGLLCRHPGERRGPDQHEKTGFRRQPESSIVQDKSGLPVRRAPSRPKAVK
jgi:hypothetical protein